MKATGSTPADQARSLGLVVGDTIEGREHDHTARLQLLWIGEDVAVWRYWSKLDGGQARCCGERADWDLRYRDWTKVGGAAMSKTARQAERVRAADELEHQCCGALASGPHKMGCDHKLMQAAAPTDDEHWCELCGDSLTTLKHDEAIGYYRDCAHCGSAYQGKEERAMSQKPCRCGPDGCADSVACPRR